MLLPMAHADCIGHPEVADLARVHRLEGVAADAARFRRDLALPLRREGLPESRAPRLKVTRKAVTELVRSRLSRERHSAKGVSKWTAPSDSAGVHLRSLRSEEWLTRCGGYARGPVRLWR